MSVNFVLASASPRRRELLRQVGIQPTVLPGRVDESAGSLPPDELVKTLSARKAREAANRLTEEDIRGETVVIGADTVVAVDGRILGKPRSEDEAACMLRRLQGRTHHVYTGVTLIFMTARDGAAMPEKAVARGGAARPEKAATRDGAARPEKASAGEDVTFAESTEVDVYPMTDEQIRRYIRTGEPMDKAGAYGIQGAFAAYIRGIRGDYNNVVGLPTGRLCQELVKRGLWEV